MAYQDTTIPYKLDMLASHFNGKLSEIRQANSDISHYVWTTADDEKVRSTHTALDGQIFAWDSPPETGHPGEDYNCRCVARPIRTRSQEEIEALLREDAIEPVYPELYVVSAVAARNILARATADMDNALVRIFQNRFARRIKGMPKEWKKFPSNKKEGYKYVKLGSKGSTDVRVQKGNPNSSNPGQRQGYVRWKKNGTYLDKNGNPSLNEIDTHIPLREFRFNKDLFK